MNSTCTFVCKLALMLCAGVHVAACASTPPPPSLTPRSLSADRVVLPRLSNEELARRTNALVAANPGWRIGLDPFGRMMSATKDLDEHAGLADSRVFEPFLVKNADALGLNDANVRRVVNGSGHVRYDQRIGDFLVGSLVADVTSTQASILSTMVRGFQATPLSDAERAAATSVLRGPSQDTPEVRELPIALVARAQGPAEFRHALCTSPPDGDFICVDAHSREDLTPSIASMAGTVDWERGKVAKLDASVRVGSEFR